MWTLEAKGVEEGEKRKNEMRTLASRTQAGWTPLMMRMGADTMGMGWRWGQTAKCCGEG